MPNFLYKAINEVGTIVRGSLNSENAQAAKEQLAMQGLIPLEIDTESSLQMNLDKFFLPNVSIKELVLFTKQFRTMLNAGVTITQILNVLQQQSLNKRLKAVCADMGQRINQGQSLHDAFSANPKVFSPLYCSMVQAGETAGSLGNVLDRLTYLLEHDAKIQKDIKGAIRYPKIIIIAIIIAFLAILTFVVPKFAALFVALKLELPWATRTSITMYDFLLKWWWAMLGVGGGFYFLLKMLARTKRGKLFVDSFLLKVPIIGRVVLMGAMSRFASIFAILQTSGVTVLESLNILRVTINNAAITLDFDNIEDKLREGRGISEPLRSSKYFTPLLINMVSIGEESGNLDAMLTDAAQHYDEEVDIAVAALMDAIPPVLMALLGGVVIFFAFAIYMPVFQIVDQMGKLGGV